MAEKVWFYPAELLMPFAKIRAELAEQFSDTSDYYAACATADKYMAVVREVLNKKYDEMAKEYEHA